MALIMFLVSQKALAHGYVSSPESRSLLCNRGANSNCGSIQYEPQSVEGADGFPASGAADGEIAAAGKAEWAALNEQGADRWAKRSLRAGPNSFSWHFTAAHVTKNFQYFITRSNWDPNQKLSRSSFALTPFCTVDGAMQKPPVDVTHECIVPERQGYHVILALWDVGDTAASFYQVIDVQFGGTNPPAAPAPSAGDPNPKQPGSTPLPPGCAVPLSPGNKLCKAKPGTETSDSWCQLNCNHVPALCPENLCACEGEDAELMRMLPRAKFRNCSAVPGSGADKQWCDINCNHSPSFCPDNLCRCS
jgi:hypothetical protein